MLPLDRSASAEADPRVALSHPRVFRRPAGFAVLGEHGRELWSSNGTGAGTGLAVDLEPGPDSFHPAALIPLGDRLVIFGSSPAQGEGFWVTDGTPAGTRKIHDKRLSGPVAWTVFKTRAFGVPLWESDGTSAGTFLLLPQTVPDTNAPQELIRAGNRVFFPSVDHSHGVELWAVGPD